jgi:hypothetical protein
MGWLMTPSLSGRGGLFTLLVPHQATLARGGAAGLIPVRAVVGQASITLSAACGDFRDQGSSEGRAGRPWKISKAGSLW